MKTLLRTLLYLALIVWLGAEIFFPVVAAITFTSLAPDTHAAGSIVGELLRILHGMGLVSGMVALAVLALAPAWSKSTPRAALAPMTLLVLMIGLTVYSQFAIIPAMERDRMAAGGAIDVANPANPTTSRFNKLHNRSEHVEEAILLLGLATVVLIAKAESEKSRE
jgi:phosphoglycerol transferase MdoB-like AlkP superfamily enzyme